MTLPRFPLGLVPLGLVPLAVACGAESATAPTPAETASEPGPALAPGLPELRALAAGVPAPPGEAKRAELAEWVEIAFSGAASPALQEEALGWLLGSAFQRVALEDGLAHGEPRVRAHCAHRLGLLGEPAAIPRLLWRERQEVEVDPLCWTIGALSALGNDYGLARLAGFVRDPAFQNLALPVVDAILLERGLEPEERSWETLATALEGLHDEWRAARRVVDSSELPPPLSARMAELLIGLNDFQLRPVDEARIACTALSRVPGDFLRIGLGAEELYLRVHSIEIVRDLGTLGAPFGADLMPLLSDPATRVYAVEALGAIGHGPALSSIVADLESDDLDLQVVAAAALGRLGDPAAIPPLRARFSDPETSADLRVHAAFGLALLEEGGEGADFLAGQLEGGSYHGPTLRELLAELEAESK